MLARSYPGWLPPALLTVLTAAAFATAIPNGFVWIDHWQVETGGLIAHSLGELWSALHQPLGSIPDWKGPAPYARPTVVAALSLVHALAGPDAAAYHLLLVALHLANVLLAYGVLLALTAAPATAFFATAIFALHPLQTAAVSWISGIADPLVAFFVLLAFRLEVAAWVLYPGRALRDAAGRRRLLRANGSASFRTSENTARAEEAPSFQGPSRSPASRVADSRSRMRALLLRLAAVLSFALALGAKETALVFPVLLVAAYVIRERTSWRRLVAVLAPFLLLVAADFAYRHLVLGAAAFGGNWAGIPFWVRLWTAPRLVVSYLTLPVRFTALTVCDDYALSSGLDASALAAAGGTILLLAGTVASLRRWPPLGFALVWLLLGLLPALNIVPILHYRADRFFYFPLIGWSLAVVLIVQRALAALRETSYRPAIHAAALVLGVLAVLTARRNLLFANDQRLFEDIVQVSPFCREAHTTLGDAYLRSGRNDDAVAQYQLALADEPDRVSYVVRPKVLINLGMAQLQRRDYAAAEAAFTEAHQLQPGLLHPIFGLGLTNLALGRISTGVSWLERAYTVDARDPDICFNLALGYDRLGRSAEAMTTYRHYLDIAPRGRTRNLAEQRLQALSAAP